jgi:hypothetical protein
VDEFLDLKPGLQVDSVQVDRVTRDAFQQTARRTGSMS